MKKVTLTDNLRSRLERLEKPPKQLSYIGEELGSHVDKPIVAIVGSRKPTPYGKTITGQIAEQLARAGVIIISGNAMGVDVLAQKSALDANGTVIAVLPSGLDKPYPATNASVVDKIVTKGGTVISEFPDGHNPTRYDFLHRNRLIAALADMVIVTEAAEKSGSLNTAKHAKDIGVPIGAIPGNVTSHMSSGTNTLLASGAHVIRSAQDILDILEIEPNKQTSLNLEGQDDTQTAILRALQEGITDPAELQSALKLNATGYQVAVTMLEVSGRIKTTELGSLTLC